MIRLYILVEGDSEERFVHELLRPHLWRCGILAAAVRVTTRRDRRRGGPDKGGLGDYTKPKGDLDRLRRQHAGNDVRFSTMFDLFRLPAGFPGVAETPKDATGRARVERLEQALANDVDEWRFVPYLQLHEFEALLLVAPECFAAYYAGQDAAVDALLSEVGGRAPEEINDGPQTAPSKRISRHFPLYDREKPTASSRIAESIGLDRMRETCPHFAAWLAKLEALAGQGDTGASVESAPRTA
jgi:hypothetical protein